MHTQIIRTLVAATLRSCGQGLTQSNYVSWTFVSLGARPNHHSKQTNEQSAYFWVPMFIIETLAIWYRQLCPTQLSRNLEWSGKVIGTDDTSANKIFTGRIDGVFRWPLTPCRLWLTLKIFTSLTRITAPLLWPPCIGPVFLDEFVAGRSS